MEREKSEPIVLTVDLIRSLLRGYRDFRALYEQEGIDFITGPDRQVWSLWDIERLYSESQKLLSPRQAEAIRLFLVEGMFEADAAERMGVSRTNPIGMYAKVGLERLIVMIRAGQISGFQAGE